MADKKYTLEEFLQEYEEMEQERFEWLSEWRTLSDFLLPGRGIYQFFSKPRKRKLTSTKVINPAGEDALNVLTSGMHGALTSPSRPWFALDWGIEGLEKVAPELVIWLKECEKRLHAGLHNSNFYTSIGSFYPEYGGFGNGSLYVGEDTDDYAVPFRFECLTAGEYLFSIGPVGKVSRFIRTSFWTPRNLVETFGNRVDDDLRRRVDKREAGINVASEPVFEHLVNEPLRDMAWTRYTYHVNSRVHPYRGGETPYLRKDGFHEFPYPVARWSLIGSDTYGIGPGSRALPDIRRLQEMEKAFLMAVHKNADPPIQAPARLRGQVAANPGDITYTNMNEEVKDLYQRGSFDLQGVNAAIERVEYRIKVNFYNDIFFTANRDPNATPYKAAEVTVREQEKMLRLGPVIESLQNEFLQPLIERCFNIMLRKKMFPEIDPRLIDMVKEYKIKLVSPLAQAQKMAALQGIQSFLSFVGNAAAVSPGLVDYINEKGVMEEYRDITGTSPVVLNTDEQVAQIRQARAAAEREKMQVEMEMANRQLTAEETTAGAKASRDQAEASKSMIEAQQMELGSI